MDRQSLRRCMEQCANGASFITGEQFMRFLGVSRSTAQRKLRSLERIDGKYYFIPDVVDEMMRQKSERRPRMVANQNMLLYVHYSTERSEKQ